MKAYLLKLFLIYITNMENYIKEAKNGFFFDKTDSPIFIENYARMMISVIAYKLVNCLKKSPVIQNKLA